MLDWLICQAISVLDSIWRGFSAITLKIFALPKIVAQFFRQTLGLLHLLLLFDIFAICFLFSHRHIG